jgi:hypothetical protein
MHKNILTILTFGMLLSFNSFVSSNADEIKSDGTVAEFNYFTVTSPNKFMKALNMFDKSDCAKKWRDESGADTSLWALRGSGSSHFILVVYENWDQMEKGRAIFTSCKESAMMINSFQQSTDTDRSWNWVSENTLAGRNWQTNTVFSKFNFKVEEGKEMEYVAAWKKLMQSQLDLIPGSFGLNTISYGNRYVSHMVYLGANSMSDLSNALKEVRGTPEFAEFAGVAKDIRANVNAELVQYVTSFNGE